MQENNTINELIAIVVSDMDASGNEPTTDSMKVAERFGKRHADVLRSIKNMDCSTEFTQRNFALSEFTDSRRFSLSVLALVSQRPRHASQRRGTANDGVHGVSVDAVLHGKATGYGGQ